MMSVDDPSLAERVHGELTYWGGSDDKQMALVRTLVRLPEDVRDLALDSVRFIGVGEETVRGLFVPVEVWPETLPDMEPEPQPEFYVLCVSEDLEGEDYMSVVAHEIAHIWLGHDAFGPADGPGEDEAYALTRDWGFSGKGAERDAA